MLNLFESAKAWIRYQVRLVRAGAARGNPLFVGVGSTKLFLVFVTVLAVSPQYSDEEWSWRFLSFLTSPANEIGDTLAGIAGTLAFLWIIVTVMMQSKELAAQREELELTRIEFRRMAEAQEKQQELMQVQSEIFLDEQKQRREEYSNVESRTIDKLLQSELLAFFERPPQVTGESGKIYNVRILQNIDDTYSQGSTVKLAPTHTLLSHLGEAFETFSEKCSETIVDFGSPRLDRLFDLINDLEVSLSASGYAVRRDLKAEEIANLSLRLQIATEQL